MAFGTCSCKHVSGKSTPFHEDCFQLVMVNNIELYMQCLQHQCPTTDL